MSKRTRNVKRILGAVGAFGFMLTLGSVGGMENDVMPLLRGTLIAFGGLTLTGICVGLNNWIDKELARIAQLRRYRVQYLSDNRQ